MKERPIEFCYWVDERFLAGEYPGHLDEEKARAKIDALLNAGVSVFIDLTEGDKEHAFIRGNKLRPYESEIGGAVYLAFPIKDMGVPESHGFTERILNAIDEHIADGHTVYVHCLGGVGRTGTVVGCWLKRKKELSGEAALKRLNDLWELNPKSAWRKTPERKEQVEYILNWNES